jgi:hypothetical protein
MYTETFIIHFSERKLDLLDFETKLKRNISPLFSQDFGELSNELKNNIHLSICSGRAAAADIFVRP